jgi:Domain of unknown function (DUF6531)
MGFCARRVPLVLLFFVGLCSWSAVAAAEPLGPAPVGLEGVQASSPLAGALVIPGSPVEGEELQARQEARASNPEAVAAREASRTEFGGLNGAQAQKLAAETFPRLIDEPAGKPRLATGERITGYPADDIAELELPEGKHGVLEASYPLAIEASAGQRTPLNLGLSESNGLFQPVTAAVEVRIPQRLGAGIQLPRVDLSLTPVDAQDTPLGGSEGALDGATVLYANTQTDTDTVLKPVPLGFETDTILRSVESPQQLFFRIGLPEGASLSQADGGSGTVSVVKEGTTIAQVLAPTATDAAGTPVPVFMSFSGDTVALTVDHRSGDYTYPIDVDPAVVEKSLSSEAFLNWAFTTDNSHAFVKTADVGTALGVGDSGVRFERGQFGYISYTTPGESRIDSFRADASTNSTYKTAIGYLALAHSSYEAGPVEIPREAKWIELTASGSNGNSALLELIATSPGSGYEVEYDVSALMSDLEIGIVQEKGPSLALDTSDEVVNGEENPLYGNRWASATTGKWGFKATATDPGLGIKRETWSSPNALKWGFTRNEEVWFGCHSVECPETWSAKYPVKGYESEQLPEGEDTVEATVEDSVGLTATTSTKVKVDDAPPHNITLTGLPSTHEISDGQHLALKASATDGKEGTPSSGIASIRLTMDGQEVGPSSKGCSPGPCSASGEWALSGENYAAGTYTLAVVATDNAGNVASEEFQLTIHHAGGVSVAPGSVNPVTGELSLSATDVSVAVPNGALTVSRAYRSRHLAQGTEGPLGPQWSLSLGAQQSLSRTPGGGMVLTGADGGQSVFASNGKGGFDAPEGDTGLALSERVVGKTSEFLLSDGGAVTTFALPSGSSGGVWLPSISEGPGGTNAATFAYRLANGVIEPTEELAPVPVGVSCSPTLNKGCRALSFQYTEETKVPGEGPSEWGEFTGHLAKVTYTAWNPAAKEMTAKVVAQYAYDKQGRLRAVWNPQIEPDLKTVYGYDAEGHVTALAPPGEQPYLLEYGTSATDAVTGRLLAVNRPAATSASVLREYMAEPAPVNTSVPTLSSTTPKVGVKISVNLTSEEKTPGTWSDKPLAFTYQWEDCNASGKECTPTPGAVNQAYYPVASDEGHTLAVVVTALP